MEITPQDYLPQEQTQDGEAFGNVEELEAAHLNQTAQALGRRARIDHFTQGVSDEDVDAGTFSERAAEGEQLLQQTIAQAARATDPAERARYNAKAEQIAAGLVTGQTKTKAETSVDETSTFEQLHERGYDIQGTLGYAGETFDDETIDELNPILKGKDQFLAREMFTVLDAHKKNPDWFVDPSEIQPLNQLQVQEIATEFGDDVAKHLEMTSLLIQNGQMTPVKAMADMMSNSKMKRAVVTLLKAGRIQLPF